MQTMKTKVYKSTWEGVPGVMTIHFMDKRRNGLRVCIMELEGRAADVRLIEGDGRTHKFKVHASGQL
ncbi:hypothetical protein ACI77O_12240 [Pseudomonas tritici]|uniref:hypothetical protein n=1 Tax=Pseudomonas tritici TaxID=2745518 RepID=UPI00387B146C